jgi:5-methylcytosine-specific restriction endonuclease McrA
MRPALRRLFLHALLTDSIAQLHRNGDGSSVWDTRCLHCRRRLHVREDGEALGHATLEHVVPQAWFGKRAASALTLQVGDNPDDARNLAIACASCNHGKGVSHDARGPADSRAFDVITQLLQRRLERWRQAIDSG